MSLEEWEYRAVVELLCSDEEREEKDYRDLIKELKDDLKSDLKSVIDWKRDDYISEWADDGVEIYDDEVFRWYSADIKRKKYADEAVGDIGDAEVVRTLQYGMYLLLLRFAKEVLDELREEESEEEEDEEEEEEEEKEEKE